MPRYMSFAMTPDAVRRREKTVTRRLGWDFLRPGDLFVPVEKAQGLKKGEHQVVLWPLCRVVSNRRERLNKLLLNPVWGWDEVQREGFPGMSPGELADMLMAANDCSLNILVNRIEFEYLPGAEP